MYNYELFTMKDNETVVDVFNGFIDVINGLQALGKVYKESEKLMKILRSLSKQWEIKVIII